VGLLENWLYPVPKWLIRWYPTCCKPCPSFQVDYRCWTTMPHIRKWMQKQGALGPGDVSLARADLGDENARFRDAQENFGCVHHWWETGPIFPSDLIQPNGLFRWPLPDHAGWVAYVGLSHVITSVSGSCKGYMNQLPNGMIGVLYHVRSFNLRKGHLN